MISFLKTSTRAHIYLFPSLQSVLHVFTVSQWSLFLKLQPALIYIYPRLYNPYFPYLQSRSDLFSSNFNPRSYISIPVSAIRTSRIYSLAVISFLKTSTRAHIYLSPSLQSVLHVFTVSQWSLFLKLQPALIYIYPRLYNRYFTYLQSRSDIFSYNFNPHSYISIPVSTTCTSRIYSLAVISFLKTSTRAHIYLSPSLQSVLHVFTVSPWSLFLKLQPALIYIYPRLYNLYFTYLQSRSDLFSYNFNPRSYISIPVSTICTSRIYSLAVISFLITSTRANIYLSPSLQSVLHVFTVSQWSLFLKLQPALIYIYSRLYNPYFTYLQSRSDLFS